VIHQKQSIVDFLLPAEDGRYILLSDRCHSEAFRYERIHRILDKWSGNAPFEIANMGIG